MFGNFGAILITQLYWCWTNFTHSLCDVWFHIVVCQICLTDIRSAVFPIFDKNLKGIEWESFSSSPWRFIGWEEGFVGFWKCNHVNWSMKNKERRAEWKKVIRYVNKLFRNLSAWEVQWCLCRFSGSSLAMARTPKVCVVQSVIGSSIPSSPVKVQLSHEK